jgi:hypothetical protein
MFFSLKILWQENFECQALQKNGLDQDQVTVDCTAWGFPDTGFQK